MLAKGIESLKHQSGSLTGRGRTFFLMSFFQSSLQVQTYQRMNAIDEVGSERHHFVKFFVV
jgi:hypothetical protein